VNIVNKRARFEFELLQTYTAGMQLLGSEVKSLREGNGSITEAFCFFAHGELFVKNMHIGTFKQASYNNHELMRVRKLLLKKVELRKLQAKASEKGLTIVPLKVFLSDTGYVKMEIAVARGKKAFDKRESIKERDIERQMQRE
jgi:SsrA-binding protein